VFVCQEKQVSCASHGGAPFLQQQCRCTNDTRRAHAGREAASILRTLASAPAQPAHLPPAVWRSLLAAVDADAGGYVKWRELVAFMTAAVKHIARDKEIAAIQAGKALSAARAKEAAPARAGGAAVARMEARRRRATVRRSLRTGGGAPDTDEADGAVTLVDDEVAEP
jgi:hypothetical protein